MRKERPDARPAKTPGAFAGRLLFLCAAGLLLASCGDFTLYPDGFGPGPSPPDNGDSVCANPFPGLSAYQGVTETPLGDTLESPAAVAMVPQGMSFSFTPEGSTEKTANPGDVLVADLNTHQIYVYLFKDDGTLDSRVVFPAGARTLGGGLALYQEEVDLGGRKIDFPLLLYTGARTANSSTTLFVKDVSPTGTTLLEFSGFAAAGALAVGRSGDTRGVFVSDQGTSIYRMSLKLDLPLEMEDRTLVASGFNEIRDIGFSNQTGALYLTEFVASITDVSTVHRVTNALTRTSSVTKSAENLFVQSSQLQASTGLALVPTNNTATTERLLVLSNEAQRALQRFDLADVSDSRELFLDPPPDTFTRQDVAYDCETASLFITHRRNQPGVGLHPGGLYALTPRD